MESKQRDFQLDSATHPGSVQVSMSNQVQPGENFSTWVKKYHLTVHIIL